MIDTLEYEPCNYRHRLIFLSESDAHASKEDIEYFIEWDTIPAKYLDIGYDDDGGPTWEIYFFTVEKLNDHQINTLIRNTDPASYSLNADTY